MLIQFNFKNFKSFKDEVSLDLTATQKSEYPNHVFKVGKEKILKFAAIYGANASGKSNVYKAFEYMQYYVIESFKFGGDNDSEQSAYHSTYRKVTPFLFNEKSREEPSTFEVFFIDPNDTKERVIQYGFSINQEEVVEEWLYTKAKTVNNFRTIFYRKKGQPTEYVNSLNKVKDNIELSLEKETLIVSLGAKLKIEILKQVRDWFLKNILLDYGNPLENLFISSRLPAQFVEDSSLQKQVIEYFASFDNSIKDFVLEKIKSSEEDDTKIKIEAIHESEDNEIIALPFDDESSGTLKMFTLFFPLRRVFENGGTLFVDELNSRLHPLLVRNIIVSFANPNINRKNAQLIFTTHDILLLDELRRDEIWFTEKNELGVSDLYSLAEFKDEDGLKIRKDEVIYKNYLLGKYGAIPALKQLLKIKED